MRISCSGPAQRAVSSAEWLASRFDRAIPWLAYPYGRYSPLVEAIARECGYRAALRGGGGPLRADAELPYTLPRLNIPAGLTPDGLILHASLGFPD